MSTCTTWAKLICTVRLLCSLKSRYSAAMCVRACQREKKRKDALVASYVTRYLRANLVLEDRVASKTVISH